MNCSKIKKLPPLSSITGTRDYIFISPVVPPTFRIRAREFAPLQHLCTVYINLASIRFIRLTPVNAARLLSTPHNDHCKCLSSPVLGEVLPSIINQNPSSQLFQLPLSGAAIQHVEQSGILLCGCGAEVLVPSSNRYRCSSKGSIRLFCELALKLIYIF